MPQNLYRITQYFIFETVNCTVNHHSTILNGNFYSLFMVWQFFTVKSIDILKYGINPPSYT